MALTKIQQIRNLLNDPARTGLDRQVGNGEANTFQFNHKKVYEGTVTVSIDGSVLSEGQYAVNYDEGYITFTSAPDSEVEIIIEYRHSVFKDSEIVEYLTLEGDSVNKVMMILLKILLLDASRRFDYESGQTKMKVSQVFDNLKQMYDLYSEEVDREEKRSNNRGGAKLIKRINSYYPGITTSERRDITRDL